MGRGSAGKGGKTPYCEEQGDTTRSKNLDHQGNYLGGYKKDSGQKDYNLGRVGENAKELWKRLEGRRDCRGHRAGDRREQQKRGGKKNRPEGGTSRNLKPVVTRQNYGQTRRKKERKGKGAGR